MQRYGQKLRKDGILGFYNEKMNFASEGYDWQVIHGKLLDNFEKKINMYSKNQKIPSVKDWETKYPAFFSSPPKISVGFFCHGSRWEFSSI